MQLMKMAPTGCTEMQENHYQSIQRNIPENIRSQTEAASVVDIFWQFHIEGLHAKCNECV